MKSIRDKLLAIPFLNRIIRVISMLINAPERFDAVTKHLDNLENRMANLDDRQDRKINDFESQTEILYKLNRELKTDLDKQSARIQHLEDIDHGFLQRVRDQVCENGEILEKLNIKLSVHPTVWGDRNRLSISPEAAVSSCLFNTNSGTITIGDYTFAGSRVSILAGSHDVYLKDFLRREAEITEGCDILIGRGVWLASGCTILGPCTIGDHAVIAAGAVVTPGTRVPSFSIYGGVPARQIGSLDFDSGSQMENEAILKALKRNGEILFVKGWRHKKPSPFRLPGYWLQDTGTIYVGQPQWTLFHYMPECCHGELTFSSRESSIRVSLSGNQGQQKIVLPCNQQKYQEYEIRRTEGNGKIMLVFEKDDP